MIWSRKKWLAPAGLLAAMTLPSCVHVDPIEVKPIHIVMDVNIRIDRELDEFFDFEKDSNASPTTQPTSMLN